MSPGQAEQIESPSGAGTRRKRGVPEGLWLRCDDCGATLFRKQVEQADRVCTQCGCHFYVPAKDRIAQLLDADSFEEWFADLSSVDPLGFVDKKPYPERLAAEQQKTGLREACLVGRGYMRGRPLVFGLTDSSFIMGSMGSVVGEKLTRAIESATELRLPIVIVSGSGGGARMHEGIFSLMQMGKVSAALGRYHESGGLFVSVLTNPTMGGVAASFASLGDVVIAEPRALVGFAGPRVVQATVNKPLPEGFQTSEFLLARGFIDRIVLRHELRMEIARIIDYCVREMKIIGKLFNRQPAVEKIDLRKRFDLIARVGQGSMSQVWRARDTRTGRTVALKILDRAKTARLDRRFVGMNRPTEGVVAVQLQHPNIVRTHEHGVSTEGEQYLVMDFIDGVGLSYLIDSQNERMRQNRIWYMVQLGEAIDCLHRLNWIHRDICPRNVMIAPDETLKLIDFGLVVPNTEAFQAPGNRTGSPLYMAPELIKRLRTDERIDIFSYGISCFEMYTQKMPWPPGDTLEAIMQHINKPPRNIRELVPELDEQVAAAIMKGLQPEPDRRWQSAKKMASEFRAAGERLGVIPGAD